MSPRYEPSARDWTEDYGHENGRYLNTCIKCQQAFQGHKRRRVCRSCTPSPEGHEYEGYDNSRIVDYPEVTPSSGNVFADMGLPDADERLRRAIAERERALMDELLWRFGTPTEQAAWASIRAALRTPAPEQRDERVRAQALEEAALSWEDVDRIRAAHGALGWAWGGDCLLGIADRIAALLPPRRDTREGE